MRQTCNPSAENIGKGTGTRNLEIAIEAREKLTPRQRRTFEAIIYGVMVGYFSNEEFSAVVNEAFEEASRVPATD